MVILIIVLVSVVALPTIVSALSHREVSESARLIQGALVGARDKAIRTNQPSGIRLLPDPALLSIVTNPSSPLFGQVDPTQILAASRIIPIDPAPDYSEGFATAIANAANLPAGWSWQAQPASPNPLAYPGGGGGTYPLGTVLVLVEAQIAAGTCPPMPNAPTSWSWNIRLGDKLQINNAGPWYTVVGPMAIPPQGVTINGTYYGNTEMFVNVGPPGVASPLIAQYVGPGGACNVAYQPEFLFVVNGEDDNGNGWTDEGWDGVDNDGNGLVDDLGEWEPEQWQGALPTLVRAGAGAQSSLTYTIRRRPAPSTNAREIALPTGVVIDLTGWALAAPERSSIPAPAFNRWTGTLDIVLNPDGTVLPTTIYSCPSSFNMGSSFVHLWLAERGDLAAPSLARSAPPYLPVPQGLAPGLFPGGQEIKGQYALVTLFARTGAFTANFAMRFDDPASPTYNPSLPYQPAQQGSAQ